MPTLEDLRKKYPRANHAPLESCSSCNGTGEVTISEEKRKRMTILKVNEKMPCMCIFVSHEDLNLVRKALKSVVDDMKIDPVSKEIQKLIQNGNKRRKVR